MPRVAACEESTGRINLCDRMQSVNCDQTRRMYFHYNPVCAVSADRFGVCWMMQHMDCQYNPACATT